MRAYFRKAQLLKDLHLRHQEQMIPLLEEKKKVEKELYFASDKFKDACKISITPVRGEKASSYNKMPGTKKKHLKNLKEHQGKVSIASSGFTKINNCIKNPQI